MDDRIRLEDVMKIKEIREMETSHLEHALLDLQKKLFELRSQAVTEKLENPSLLGKARRDIAQFKTILRQRQMQKSAEAAAHTAAAAPTLAAAAQEPPASA